jgi:hypothetical protein
MEPLSKKDAQAAFQNIDRVNQGAGGPRWGWRANDGVVMRHNFMESKLRQAPFAVEIIEKIVVNGPKEGTNSVRVQKELVRMDSNNDGKISAAEFNSYSPSRSK